MLQRAVSEVCMIVIGALGAKAVYCSCGPGIPSSCFVFAEPISERDNIWRKRTMRLRSHPLSECLSLKRRGLEQACWETGEGIAYGPSYSDTAERLSLLLTHSRLLSNSLTRTSSTSFYH